jgi:hypothetical protein
MPETPARMTRPKGRAHAKNGGYDRLVDRDEKGKIVASLFQNGSAATGRHA